MEPSTERRAVQQVGEQLAEVLGLLPAEAKVRADAAAPDADAVIDVAGFTFVVEWKGSGSAAPVATAARQARTYATTLGGRAIPLVAVPFMGTVGRERCEEADIGWLDLSGNARIFAPGIRVRIDGQPNRFSSAREDPPAHSLPRALASRAGSSCIPTRQ